MTKWIGGSAAFLAAALGVACGRREQHDGVGHEQSRRRHLGGGRVHVRVSRGGGDRHGGRLSHHVPLQWRDGRRDGAVRRSPHGRSLRCGSRHELRVVRGPDAADVHARLAARVSDDVRDPPGRRHDEQRAAWPSTTRARPRHGRPVDHGRHDDGHPRRDGLGHDGQRLAQRQRQLRDGLPVEASYTDAHALPLGLPFANVPVGADS